MAPPHKAIRPGPCSLRNPAPPLATARGSRDGVPEPSDPSPTMPAARREAFLTRSAPTLGPAGLLVEVTKRLLEPQREHVFGISGLCP
jgi:hypothetical protein